MQAMHIHANPYKTQNRSPAHKAMKTFNLNKQIHVHLTPCKYKDQKKLPVS